MAGARRSAFHFMQTIEPPTQLTPLEIVRATITPEERAALARRGLTEQATLADMTRALEMLRGFIGPSQLRTVQSLARGEERQFFYDKMVELAAIVSTMPTTGQQDGKGDEAIAYLRYFAGGQAQCYITERDIGCEDDTPEMFQSQAFGHADLFGDGGELGYICLPEWLQNRAELDFHFTPKTLREIKGERD